MNSHKVDMDKICDGCLTHERHKKERFGTSIMFYGECSGYIRESIECPCQHCLVKGMCDSVCEKLRKTEWYTKNHEDVEKFKFKKVGIKNE